MIYCNVPFCLHNKENEILKGEAFQTYHSLRLPPLTSAYIHGICENKAWILYQRNISVDRCGIVFRIFRGPFQQIEKGNSLLIPHNLNEYSENQSCVKICTNPKNIIGGTEIDGIMLAGLDTSCRFRQTIPTLEQKMRILKSNTDYVIQFQNTKTVGEPTTVHINWAWIEKSEAFFK